MSKVLMLIKGIGGYPKNGTSRRNSLIFKLVAAVLFISLVTTGIVTANYSNNVNNGLSESLIRLHVIANSDSAADQALKRDVRDKILEYMKVQLKDSKNIDETKDIIKRDMGTIEEIARREIARQGKEYSVRTTLGNYPFPTKTYGDIALPAGYYQALRVVIGKGDGANWWCVLFPPLCFVDATHGTVPDSVKNDLKNVLSKDEYSIVTSTDSDTDIPVKVKFKIVELFQKSKQKVSKFLSSLF